jgi:hypothetical protein
VTIMKSISAQTDQDQSSLAALPIEFAEERGWGPVVSQVPFMGIFLGAVLGGGANVSLVWPLSQANANQFLDF